MKKSALARRARARWSALALALIALVATLINAALAWLRLRAVWPSLGAGVPSSSLEERLSGALGFVAYEDSLFYPVHYFLIALVALCSIVAVGLAVRAWRSKVRAKKPGEPPIPLP